MAWVDSMRLRGRAEKLRTFGWLNLLLSIGWCLVHAAEGLPVLVMALGWGGTAMVIAYASAWALDRRADRVVTR